MKRSAFGTLSVAISMSLAVACGAGSRPQAALTRGLSARTMTSLGGAQSFSVLAGQTVTNTGPSTLSGDLGVFPGTAITGFPPGLANGTTHSGDAAANEAQDEVTVAYDLLAASPCTSDESGTDLGERTLTAGVYCFSSEAQLSGTLVLDAKFVADAVFVFQITSKLTTASNASIRLINGANPCNVFWQVGSSATIGTGTAFVGNILALTSIALEEGASLDGRALARNGEVTLADNQIKTGQCKVVPEESCCFGAAACSGACVSLQADANNCGACGKACSASEVCSAGACTSCPANRTQCSEQCADLATDPFNCGACGNVCGTSQSCVAGACGSCDGTVCANSCVELGTDRANCGACGHACAADQCCHAGSCSSAGPAGSCKQR